MFIYILLSCCALFVFSVAMAFWNIAKEPMTNDFPTDTFLKAFLYIGIGGIAFFAAVVVCVLKGFGYL